MSGKIMGAVWDLDLPHSKQLVLLSMADHADHNGENVFPSIGLVAWKTGYSIRQVQRIQHDLVSDGLLEIVKQTNYASTVYRINVSAGNPKKPYVSKDDLRDDKMSPPITAPKKTNHRGRGDTIMSSPGVTQLRHPNRHIEPSIKIPSAIVAKAPLQSVDKFGIDDPQSDPVHLKTLEAYHEQKEKTERLANYEPHDQQFSIPTVTPQGQEPILRKALSAGLEVQKEPLTPSCAAPLPPPPNAPQPPATPPNAAEASPMPQNENKALLEAVLEFPPPPKGFAWVYSSATDQPLAHLTTGSMTGPTLCKSKLNFREFYNPGRTVIHRQPCAECLRIATAPKTERKRISLSPLQKAIGTCLLKQTSEATMDANRPRINTLQRTILTCENYPAGVIPDSEQSQALADSFCLKFIPWYEAETLKRYGKKNDLPAGNDTLPKWYGEWVGLGKPGTATTKTQADEQWMPQLV